MYIYCIYLRVENLSKRLLIFMIALALLIITVSALLAVYLKVENSGVVATAGLSLDKYSISWGLISSNETKTMGLTVTNNGTVPLVLSTSTMNWDPSGAEQYFNLTASFNSIVLAPDESVIGTLFLTVSENITGIKDFRFDILISGTE